MVEVETFISKYIKAIQNENAAIFAGAGLSSAAGYVSWKELLRETAAELHLDVDKEHDLVALAQFHVNETRSRNQINQQIIEKLSEKAKIGEVHRIIANLPIKTFWTTNYDTLIEDTLKENNKKVDKKIDQTALSINLPNCDAVVYKMHGDIQIPKDAIITKDDYETYNEKRQLFTTALQGDLITKTFLFIGFSFEDPNLNYILSRIRILLGENKRDHYAFFKRPLEKEYSTKDEFVYAQYKQKHLVEDLKRYSINSIIIDSYEEIPTILKRIEYGINLRNIFISGSANEYGSWDVSSAHDLIDNLVESLLQKDCKIFSGFGLGIGSFVINSAVQLINSYKYGHLDDYLKINPFPFQLDDKSKADFNTKYRNNLLEQCRVSIFLFGNKKIEDSVIIADGVIEEFEIAKSKGHYIIPIGSTGFASEQIFSEIETEITKYPYLIEYLDVLKNSKNNSELIAAISNILKSIMRS